MTRGRRALLWGGVAVAFLLLVGATYQGVATALERRRYARPGRLVDVGGHQLHLWCAGQGRPTVILEAPAGGLSAAWGRVQPALATETRVCSYDRTGLGWSEAREGGFEARFMPDDLDRLLASSGEEGPFVLVGHGLGALVARATATRHPSRVLALVLVDEPEEGSLDPAGVVLQRFPALTPWLARFGLLRASGVLAHLSAGLPDPARGALATFLNRPDHLTRSAREMAQWDALSALGRPVPATVPVTRVTTDPTGPRSRLAFLTTEAKAASVVKAVVEVVTRARL